MADIFIVFLILSTLISVIRAIECYQNNAPGDDIYLDECNPALDICGYTVVRGQVFVDCTSSNPAVLNVIENVFFLTTCPTAACNTGISCEQCQIGQTFCTKDQLAIRPCQSLLQTNCGVVEESSQSNSYWGGCLRAWDVEQLSGAQTNEQFKSALQNSIQYSTSTNTYTPGTTTLSDSSLFSNMFVCDPLNVNCVCRYGCLRPSNNDDALISSTLVPSVLGGLIMLIILASLISCLIFLFVTRNFSNEPHDKDKILSPQD